MAFLTQNPSSAFPMPVNDASLNMFYVAELNAGLVTLTATHDYDDASESLPVTDAVADFYVNIETMKHMFQFSSTDLNLTLAEYNNNVTDVLEQLHFYIIDSSLNAIKSIDIASSNVSEGYVTTNAGNGPLAVGKLEDGQQSIATDFVQNLSKKSFGSGLYDTFFINASALMANTRDVLNAAYVSETISVLHSQSDASLNNAADDNNSIAHLNASVTGIVHSVWQQMWQNFPERFDITNGLLQADTTANQPLPFVAGDAIAFTVTIEPKDPIYQKTVNELGKSYLVRLIAYTPAEVSPVPDWCQQGVGKLGCVV